MYGAKQVDAQSAPELYRMVEKLARERQIPMPKVYITENPQPNAFATGPRSRTCGGVRDHGLNGASQPGRTGRCAGA